MSRAGVKDIPEIEVDLKRAGYESLMGFAVGGTIGGFRGSRGYSKYFDAESDVLDVDERGNPIFKKPNEKGYVGAGALRMQARRMIDADNPVDTAVRRWMVDKAELLIACVFILAFGAVIWVLL